MLGSLSYHKYYRKRCPKREIQNVFMEIFTMLYNPIGGGVSIYFTICFITNILFVRLSTKWDHLLDLVATSELDEYIDSSMKFKCNFVTVAIMSFSFVEHAIQKTFKILMVYNCHWSDINLHSYQQYLRATYTYAFDLNLPYSIGFGILIQILSLIASFIWSYSHAFIICISFYLTSILELLNKKIISCEGKDLPPSHWRALREDYNRATLLIRSFDDVINSIMFIVTANDLFFVCCQLYYLIGFLIGYEFIVYLIISVIFYTTRFFSVLLIAAKIHTASLVVTPSLYNVATSSYCCEVQRFIEKINGDTVALTGLNFFYTTRDLILSVIGTIVTYELVLLQFQRDQIT
ncbi:unnamed protein product [Euphydryas editha]|uniref:Gustatory receptor n=1 Tax=Euphydryas editha TaxID=104508 RepID=A0AAU9UPF7_EUPED|nr:unnamed protein product [Euphydryas editha]